MLNDMQATDSATANTVMMFLSSLEEAVSWGYDLDYCCIESAASLLAHLYEMHELRDMHIYFEVRAALTPPTGCSAAQALAWYWAPFNALMDM